MILSFFLPFFIVLFLRWLIFRFRSMRDRLFVTGMEHDSGRNSRSVYDRKEARQSSTTVHNKNKIFIDKLTLFIAIWDHILTGIMPSSALGPDEYRRYLFCTGINGGKCWPRTSWQSRRRRLSSPCIHNSRPSQNRPRIAVPGVGEPRNSLFLQEIQKLQPYLVPCFPVEFYQPGQRRSEPFRGYRPSREVPARRECYRHTSRLGGSPRFPRAFPWQLELQYDLRKK